MRLVAKAETRWLALFPTSDGPALYGVGSSFEILPLAGDLRSVVKPLFWRSGPQMRRSAIAVMLFTSAQICVPPQEVS